MNTVSITTPELLIGTYQDFLKTKDSDLLKSNDKLFSTEAVEILKSSPEYVYFIHLSYLESTYQKVRFISGKLDETGNTALVLFPRGRKPRVVAMNRLIRVK